MASQVDKDLDEAIRNLDREIGRKKSLSMAGLLAAGLVVQRGAQERVPVHYGNLRASAYTRKAEENDMAVEVGFEAVYALAVHENLEAKWKGKPRQDGVGEYWGPHGEPQFLLRSLEDNHDEILRLVEEYSSR